MADDPLRDRDEDNSESLNDSAAEEPRGSLAPRLARFEQLYRAEFGHVAAYFARRTLDPQLVADLTADTFVAAMQSFDALDPGRDSAHAWVLGISRRVFARHRESDPRSGKRPLGLSQRLLDAEEERELLLRIEVERSSRELIARLERMSALDREAVELVDLCGLTPAQAAGVLDISTGALRVRLARTRARLRRESIGDV